MSTILVFPVLGFAFRTIQFPRKLVDRGKDRGYVYLHSCERVKTTGRVPISDKKEMLQGEAIHKRLQG
jgi:hypothetical protein